MDEEEAVQFKRKRQLLNVLGVCLCELLVRPLRGDPRERVEVFRFRKIQSGLVVIPQQYVRRRRAYELDAFIGICSVADDISQTNQLVNLLLRDDLKRFLESLKI